MNEINLNASDKNEKNNLKEKKIASNDYDFDFDEESSSDTTEEDYYYPSTTNSKRELLLSYAHPLIVVDYERLESCYNQLKDIMSDNNVEIDDRLLVKSIITNEYDLNSVLLNDVFK